MFNLMSSYALCIDLFVYLQLLVWNLKGHKSSLGLQVKLELVGQRWFSSIAHAGILICSSLVFLSYLADVISFPSDQETMTIATLEAFTWSIGIIGTLSVVGINSARQFPDTKDASSPDGNDRKWSMLLQNPNWRCSTLGQGLLEAEFTLKLFTFSLFTSCQHNPLVYWIAIVMLRIFVFAIFAIPTLKKCLLQFSVANFSRMCRPSCHNLQSCLLNKLKNFWII